MELSVVCPVYNEEKYIDQLIRFFINSSPEEKELILIDGGSTDKTVSIITEYIEQYPQIQILQNPKKTVPHALNLAIEKAKANIIVRLDAHTRYSQDYFEKIIETFYTSGADIVGGPTRTAFENKFQQAVGIAISSPFGIGNSKVHDIDYRGYTDSVTFGAWKSEIFPSTGLFDTNLVRNQDDEFHYRAKSAGFKIFQNPEIKLFYYPRNTLAGLIMQYFQYGLYKPLVLKKVRSEIKIRHLVPSLFVLYLLSFLPVSMISWFYSIPLIVYLVTDLIFSAINDCQVAVKFRLFYIYPAIHLSYGFGFLLGLRKLITHDTLKSG